jgi:hypothetical protein
MRKEKLKNLLTQLICLPSALKSPGQIKVIGYNTCHGQTEKIADPDTC